MPNPLDYIIGAGDGISKVASAYDDRLPADPNQVALMRHAQDVINGRMSPQEAAMAYHQSVQTPGWTAADAAPYMVPNPGGMTVQNPAFPGAPQPQPQGGMLSEGEHRMPGAMQGGLSGEGAAMGVAPQTQALQQPAQVPQRASAEGYGVGLSGQGVPPVSMNFTNMTKGQARELQPQLERMASAKFSSNALQDQIALERERQKGRVVIEDKKQTGKQQIAAYNASESMKRTKTRIKADMDKFGAKLDQDESQFGRLLSYKYAALRANMDEMDKKIEVMRSAIGTDNALKAATAIVKLDHDLRTAGGEIINGLNSDEQDAIDAKFGIKVQLDSLAPAVEEARDLLRNRVTSPAPVQETPPIPSSGVKVEKSHKSESKPKGVSAQDLSAMFGK